MAATTRRASEEQGTARHAADVERVFEAADERDGSRHVLCRQRFTFPLTAHLNGVEIHRKQLPAQHAWAMSINKSQGRTIPRAIVDMRVPFWQHGSGHVAFSRIPRSVDSGVFTDRDSVMYDERGRAVPILRNVVYPGLVVS
jgi:hypothetical protein